MLCNPSSFYRSSSFGSWHQWWKREGNYDGLEADHLEPSTQRAHRWIDIVGIGLSEVQWNFIFLPVVFSVVHPVFPSSYPSPSGWPKPVLRGLNERIRKAHCDKGYINKFMRISLGSSCFWPKKVRNTWIHCLPLPFWTMLPCQIDEKVGRWWNSEVPEPALISRKLWLLYTYGNFVLHSMLAECKKYPLSTSSQLAKFLVYFFHSVFQVFV